MKFLEKYNPVILPTYRYATLPCSEMFQNINFDEILKEIGKFYFHQPEAGLNAVCTLIRDEINREWKLNGYKKRARMKRVSTTQIKTIRRAFFKITSGEEKYIRIPFNVVSILYFIINLLNRIEDENSSIHKYFTLMNKTCISDYLYSKHTKIFRENLVKRKNQLTDEELKCKYDKLNANLTGQYSIMQKKHSDVDWDNGEEYIIK